MWISYLGSDPYGVGGTARSAVPGQPIGRRSKRHNQFHLSWSQYWDRHQGLTGPSLNNSAALQVGGASTLAVAGQESLGGSLAAIGNSSVRLSTVGSGTTISTVAVDGTSRLEVGAAGS